MTAKKMPLIALMSGIVLAAWVSGAEAFTITAERAAALRYCNVAAIQRYPDPSVTGFGRNRDLWYRSCMAEAGQLP